MTTIKDDIQEVKDKVSSIDTKLNAFFIAHAQDKAEMKAHVSRNSGKINTIITLSGLVFSGLAYAVWDWIKAKLM